MRPWSLLGAIPRWFSRLGLAAQFLIVSSGALCCSMVILGSWITNGISESTLNSAARTSSMFMGTFLEPFVQSLPPDGTMPIEQIEQLDQMLNDTPLGQRLIAVKIWRADGTIIYSTRRELVGQQFAAPEVAAAANGDIVASYDALDNNEGARERATGLPIIEIYAPLRRADGHEIIAVGEYYEHAPWFAEGQDRARLTTWGVVGITTATMIGILFLLVMRGSAMIANQRKQLDQRIQEADHMAAQNENLRLIAEKARHDANEANEHLLARIGADLHDGPIQMLSLLTLRLSAEEPDESKYEPFLSGSLIAQNALTELRTISAGLVLPEIENIDLRGALQLAILRHEDITGSKVISRFGSLPPKSPLMIKTCAYRVVQEALSNAHKHAVGAQAEVYAAIADQHLLISVSDNGPGIRPERRVAGRRDHLGLAGIRNRVNALKGHLSIEQREGGGAHISVLLPVAP